MFLVCTTVKHVITIQHIPLLAPTIGDHQTGTGEIEAGCLLPAFSFLTLLKSLSYDFQTCPIYTFSFVHIYKISGLGITCTYTTCVSATVTIVDIDSGAEDRIMSVSPGSATGLNLKENQKIYFGGLPTIGNYR